MPHDAQKIVSNLKSGTSIKRDELSFIRTSLKSPLPDSDIHHLCRALALSVTPNKDDIALVEQYLSDSYDEWDIQGVIYALCNYWKLTANYIDKLIVYVDLEQWEDSPSAAIAAIGVLGDYLYENKNPTVLKSLLTAYEQSIELHNKGLLNFNRIYADTIYQAINASIVGRQAALDAIGFRFPRDVNLEIIEKAYKNLKLWSNE